MLAFAEDAEQRLHEDQTQLRGHLRLFSSIDLGQFLFTRLIVNFLKANPLVTVELGYNNRPLHMIQEGCDAGLMLGTITDENVVARPAGKVARCIVASPALVKSRPALKGAVRSQIVAVADPIEQSIRRLEGSYPFQSQTLEAGVAAFSSFDFRRCLKSS
jgi:DNA-binding transcriptional LysR family regulator